MPNACAKPVQTGGISCVEKLPAVGRQTAHGYGSVDSRQFSPLFLATNPQLLHTSHSLVSLCMNTFFTQFPHHLLLLQRNKKKDI